MNSAVALREMVMVSNPSTRAKKVGTSSVTVTLSWLGSPGTTPGSTSTSTSELSYPLRNAMSIAVELAVPAWPGSQMTPPSAAASAARCTRLALR